MPKTTAIPPALNLSAAKKHDGRAPMSPSMLSTQSLNSPMSPRSMPGSPPPEKDDNMRTNGPASPRITAMPEFPPSPNGSKQSRDHKSFFANFKASKSSHRLQSSDQSLNESTGADGKSRASSRDRHLHSFQQQQQDSTPDLPRVNVNNNNVLPETPDERAWNNQGIPGSSDGLNGMKNKNKSKLGGILNRTRNGRVEDDRRQKPLPGLTVNTQGYRHGSANADDAPLKTAPLKSDYRERTFGAELGSTNRTRSADRHGSNDGNTLQRPPTTTSAMASSLPKEPSSLFANISQTGKGVGQTLGKASKGFFSKMTRSGSSTEREMPTEENYVCSVINQPLVQQTRKTRIAKRMELSKDKTEFWMPALPWRCIDYLNMNGCEEEGLYRIPGSGREVKMWQKRFDTEYDIDLFKEPDLYDINTIGSMFKSWLRELPDEILPKAVQNKIAQECAGAQTPPQLFKDEISKLPPFNYYLLFAITCHLSLLHSFAEKNKMDFRNLCICFQPCLKIDAFSFSFLVLHWKECFQGCWTEREFLQEEYRWEREGSTHSATNGSSVDDRAISSSGSSQVIAHHQVARSAESGIPRKGSAPQVAQVPLHHKTTSASSAVNKGHGNSNSLPHVPRIVKQTPEQRPSPDSQLPELGNLSPLRM